MTIRRVVFQLTPLLDLLMIVIFAQYMDIHGSSRKVVRTSHEMVRAEQRKRLQAERERHDAQRLRQEALGLARAHAETIGKLRAENDQLRLAATKVMARADEIRRQAEEDLLEIGRLAREMLQIDEALLVHALRDLSLEEKVRVRRDLEDLRGQSATAVVRYLRKAAEIRKQCDVWEVHVGADDLVRLKHNGRPVGDNLYERSADGFAERVMPRLLSVGEPKSLVLFFYTYDNCTLAMDRRVRTAMERCFQLLRARGYNKRFVLSDLGRVRETP